MWEFRRKRQISVRGMLLAASYLLVVVDATTNFSSNSSTNERDHHDYNNHIHDDNGDLLFLHGFPIVRYTTAQHLEGLDAPPTRTDLVTAGTSASSKMNLPAHLQYVLAHDQLGIMVSETGLAFGDPESAYVASHGVFSQQQTTDCWFFCSYFSPDHNKQKQSEITQTINRCGGGGWAFYWQDITRANGRPLWGTGKAFFARIRRGPPEFCPLHYAWKTTDFTSAVITGYLEERFQYTPILRWFPEFSARRFTLTIDLMPYWAWKFGLPYTDRGVTEEILQELDSLCCPPPREPVVQSCRGPGVLGEDHHNDDSPCGGTISQACGAPSGASSLSECAMWSRKNFLFGFIPVVGEYFDYPIGDKDRRLTGFFPLFQEALAQAGVTQVFHGLL